MERILIHPLAGVLSAYGIGIANVKAIRDASVLRPLGEDFADALAELERRARDALIEQHVHADRIELHRGARLRTAGSDTTLEIDVGPPEEMRAVFSELHRRRFGYMEEGAEVIVDALVVEAIGKSSSSLLWEGDRLAGRSGGGVGADPSTIDSFDGSPPPDKLGEEFVGPALIFDPSSTTV